MLDLHTRDGHMTADFRSPSTGGLARRSIHGKINGGGNLITIHTGDGSIRLEKS